MRLLDEDGTPLDASFDVEATIQGADIVLHSRSGISKSGQSRNPAYFPVLETILRRLSELGATITRVSIDSSVARKLPLAVRTIPLAYPLKLSEDDDALVLRRQITEGQRTVASDIVDRKPGGNKHKRIRLEVDLRATQVDAALLIGHLRVEPRNVGRPSIGRPYQRATPNPSVRPADVFTVDSSARERALAGHARTQNALADHLAARGLKPRSPTPGEPDFDLAWDHGEMVVAEVKSLSGTDPTQQLRLGLGQVLHYRQLLEVLYGPTRAVLAVEYEPPEVWRTVCAGARVDLSWPPEWPGLNLVPLTP
jgi:hypothetical protein